MHRKRAIPLLAATLFMVACGGGGDPGPTTIPHVPHADILGARSQLVFRWLLAPGATHYKVLENADGHSGYTQLGDDVQTPVLGSVKNISVHDFDFLNALYIVEACNNFGCTQSKILSPRTAMLDTIGYFKATNTETEDRYGNAIALSADGTTLAIGSLDDSDSNGIDAEPDNNDAESAGAVFVFQFDGVAWHLASYIKAPVAETGDRFGTAVALSADGSTLAVGSMEDSDATGIGGNDGNNDAESSGAVHVYRSLGMTWSHQAYIKAGNAGPGDTFGSSVALSNDGNTLLVGAPFEDTGAADAGAAYVFAFEGQAWNQSTMLTATNAGAGDRFGSSVSLSGDGSALVIGAPAERSASTSIDGGQDDDTLAGAGAAYVFRRNGNDWNESAYLKPASYPGGGSAFGGALAMSADGGTIAVGAALENNAANGSGAAYLFRFDGVSWNQQAYIKASNAGAGDGFGTAIALSASGNDLLVSAPGEDSRAIGVFGDSADDSAQDSGAAYFFRFDGAGWQQHSYIKSSNTDEADGFGTSVGMSANGERIAVSAPAENGSSIGITGDRLDNAAPGAGAVYLY